VIVAIMVAVATLLWLTPWAGQRSYPLYAEFDQVDGITKAALVQLGGYDVGRVADVEPRIKNDGSVVFRVRMNITRRLPSGDAFPLPLGTRARLVPPPAQVISGFIVLEAPRGGGPPLEPGATIPGVRAPAMLEEIQALTARTTSELAQSLGVARILMDTLTRAASAANQTAAFTAAALPSLMQGLQAELVAVEALTQDLRTHVGTLTPAAAASIDSATLLLADSRLLVQGMSHLLTAREPELSRMLASLDTSTILLKHTLREVGRRPYRAFTGVAPPPEFSPLTKEQVPGMPAASGCPAASGMLSNSQPTVQPAQGDTVTVRTVPSPPSRQTARC
jgi:ABC-type transporter Mla subunit MlaD